MRSESSTMDVCSERMVPFTHFFTGRANVSHFARLSQFEGLQVRCFSLPSSSACWFGSPRHIELMLRILGRLEIVQRSGDVRGSVSGDVSSVYGLNSKGQLTFGKAP